MIQMKRMTEWHFSCFWIKPWFPWLFASILMFCLYSGFSVIFLRFDTTLMPLCFNFSHCRVGSVTLGDSVLNLQHFSSLSLPNDEIAHTTTISGWELHFIKFLSFSYCQPNFSSQAFCSILWHWKSQARTIKCLQNYIYISENVKSAVKGNYLIRGKS